MNGSNEMITCEYDSIEKNTGRAYLVDFGDQEHWLPASLVKFDFQNKKVTMPEWKYNQLGLNDWKDENR